METVTELYEKVNSEKDKDQIKSELLTYVQTLEDNYLAEEITYEDAIRTMEDLRDVVFTDGEIEDIMHMVSKIHDSRENFAKAEKLAATGTWKDYYDAIGYYEEVVSDDTLYYDKAQDAIANCKTECISAAEAEADGYIADGDYDAAVSFLEDAYYDTGYNELYDKMDQVKADMKDALLEKAIENAKAEVAAGNYTEARSIINNAKEDYGYDSRFDDILAGIPVDTSLVGKWKLEYDMNDIIAETVGEDMDNFDSEFYVTFIFEFTEDGICRLSLDEDSFVKSFDSWKDDLLDYLIDMADRLPDVCRKNFRRYEPGNLHHHKRRSGSSPLGGCRKGGQRHSDTGCGAGAGKLHVPDSGGVNQAGKFNYYRQQVHCLRQPY